MNEIHLLLCREKIPHEVRDYANDLHCGGWVDFGDFSRKCDGEGAKNFFRNALCQGRVFLPVLSMGSYFPVDGRESCTKKVLEKITLIFGIGLCPISKKSKSFWICWGQSILKPAVIAMECAMTASIFYLRNN